MGGFTETIEVRKKLRLWFSTRLLDLMNPCSMPKGDGDRDKDRGRIRVE